MDADEVKATIAKNKREPKKRDIQKELKQRKVRIQARHRLALEELKKGKSLTGAMIAVGYKPNTALNAHMVTKTQSWQMLMDEQLPEDVVAQRHRELLDMRLKKTIKVGKNKYEEVDAGIDPAVIHSVKLAYQLRGRTMSDTPPPARPNVYNLFYNADVQANVKAFEEALKNRIAYEVDRPSIESDRTNTDGIIARDIEGSDAGTVEEVGGIEREQSGE